MRLQEYNSIDEYLDYLEKEEEKKFYISCIE